MSLAETVIVLLVILYMMGIGYLFGRLSGYTEGWEAAKQVFCTWHKTDKEGGK